MDEYFQRLYQYNIISVYFTREIDPYPFGSFSEIIVKSTRTIKCLQRSIPNPQKDEIESKSSSTKAMRTLFVKNRGIRYSGVRGVVGRFQTKNQVHC